MLFFAICLKNMVFPVISIIRYQITGDDISLWQIQIQAETDILRQIIFRIKMFFHDMIFFLQFRKHFPGKQRKVGLSYEGFSAAPAGHAVFKQVDRLMGVSVAVVNFLIFENVVPIQTRDRWNLFQF